MKIILDRFPRDKTPFFCEYFSQKGYEVKVLTIVGSKSEQIDDSSFEIYGDFQIANGSSAKNIPWHLDDDLMSHLDRFEGLFLTTLSRFVLYPGSWTLQDMSDHYFQLANFWVDCIKRNKISHCVSYYIPHDPSSLALYAVTKILKIPYVFIDLPHAARNIRFVSCSFTQRNLLLRSGDQKIPDWAFNILAEYKLKISQDFLSAQPMFMNSVNNHIYSKNFINKMFNSFKITSLAMRKAIYIIIKKENRLSKILNRFLPKPFFFKVSGSKWYSEQFQASVRLKWLLAKFFANIRILMASKRYNKIASYNHLNKLPKKYIYFPLPLEPEGSTLPTAGNAKSVLIAIKRLISVMPSDCYLVLKISPVQFQHGLALYSTLPAWHSNDFYDDLSRVDKILFVSDNVNSGDLIKCSMGVACINGTAAVEAATFGKHSIIFAPMWYDSLASVHLCKSQKDLIDAMRSMERNEPFDLDLRDFFMSASMIFDQKSFIDCDFEDSVLIDAANCLLSGLEEFEKLDSRKWEF